MGCSDGRRNKFDPLWNELVVAGFRDGKPCVSSGLLPPPAPFAASAPCVAFVRVRRLN
jgi:hypothetical protein